MGAGLYSEFQVRAHYEAAFIDRGLLRLILRRCGNGPSSSSTHARSHPLIKTATNLASKIMLSLTDASTVGAFAEHCPAWPRFIDGHDRRHLATPLKKQSSRAVLHRQHRLMGVTSSMSGNVAMCSRRFLLDIERPPAQGRGFFRPVGLHPPSRNGSLSCHVTRCGNECQLHPRSTVAGSSAQRRQASAR